MKRLILILNGKGGVGKSFFAVNLVQYFVDQKLPHLALDSDNENSTLKRFHPKAGFIDLSITQSLDEIFTPLNQANLVVTDCRAASTDLFLDYFSEIELPEVLATLRTAMTLAVPINHEPDSIDQLQRLSDQLGTSVSYLIIKNASHSDRFSLYESSQVRKVLIQKLKAREINMERMRDWLVEQLQRENATPTAAATHPCFSLLDRQRLQSWQRRFYQQLDSSKDLILPTP